MNILLIELSTHASDLGYCVNALYLDHQLTICTSKETLTNASLNRLLSEPTIQLVTWSGEEDFPYLAINEWTSLWARHDHTIFITEITDSAFLSTFFSARLNYSLFVHNAHSSVWQRPPFYKSLLALGAWLKNSLLKRGTSRCAHAKNASGLIFPTESGAAYLVEKGDTRVKFGYPWAISSHVTRHSVSEVRLSATIPIRIIAFPGELDSRRRNFSIIEKLIDSWEKEKALKIDFVGPAESTEGREILRNFKRRASGKLEIVGDGNWVSSGDYVDRLQAADVLVLNHSVITRYGYVKELGGKTKVSGVLHDAIRQQKKVFVNSGYHLSKELIGFVIVYENAMQLKTLIEGQLQPVPQSVWDEFSLLAHRRRWTAYLANFL